MILRDGALLSASQLADAYKIGVTFAQHVRLLKVTTIPVPDHSLLREAAESTHLITPLTAGLTLRYGIFIRKDRWEDRCLVFHELVHTYQYERLGGVQPFLERYLYECLAIGYPEAPLEQEAIQMTEEWCV